MLYFYYSPSCYHNNRRDTYPMTTPLALFRALARVRRPVRRAFVVSGFSGQPPLRLACCAVVESGQLPEMICGPIAVFRRSLTIFGLRGMYAFTGTRAQLVGGDLGERERILGTRSYA